MHIEAWTFERTRLRLLERRTIAPALKHWNGNRVDSLISTPSTAALADLIRTYARDLLNQRWWDPLAFAAPPAGWPSSRGTPSRGFYDYLRPFYAVRGYRHKRTRPSAGHYPVKLRHDIRSVLRFERADLAGRLTLAHVNCGDSVSPPDGPTEPPHGRAALRRIHGTRREKKPRDILTSTPRVALGRWARAAGLFQILR